jgi:hypothetical protein
MSPSILDRSDTVEPEASQPGAEQRRHKRRSGMWGAEIETAQGNRVDCTVLDLSDGGAKLLLKQPVAVGKIVTLIGNRIGSRGGRIAWAIGTRVGLEFIDAATAVVSIAGASAEIDIARDPAPGPTQKFTGLDPNFMRGRARALRCAAEANANPAIAAMLFRSAEAMEAEAALIEHQQG